MAKVTKPKVVKKKRVIPITTLKKRLWPIYSEYIRLSHADKAGIVTCVSCKAKYPWSGDRNIHCGHFFSKKFYSCIMYEEINTHPICSSCNRKQSSGESYLYYLYLLEKYGAECIKKLYEKALLKIPYTREQLQEKLEYYTLNLKAMKIVRGIT